MTSLSSVVIQRSYGPLPAQDVLMVEVCNGATILGYKLYVWLVG